MVNMTLLKNGNSGFAICARVCPALAGPMPDLSTISTPCRKVCIVDGASGLCIGCGRTLSEIAAWGAFAEEQRQAIMAQLPARLETIQPR